MINVNNPISLESGPILDRIGYGEVEKPSRRIVSLVDDYIDNYNEFIAPTYSYISYRVDGSIGNRVYLGKSISFESKLLSRMLGNCETVAIFVVTIGGYLEDIVDQLSRKGMILEATVLEPPPKPGCASRSRPWA